MLSALLEAQLAADLATALYDFLPGTPHPRANPDLSFPGAARAAHLRHPWSGGSKTPALTQLLTATLRDERQRFCPFLVAVVQRAVVYRRAKAPLTRDEMERVNALVAQLGFRIPELHDAAFLDALPRAATAAPPSALPNDVSPRAVREPCVAERQQLTDDLLALHSLAPTPRGLAFERFLNALFLAYHLAPRAPFSLVGEQIDGSFMLADAVYLLEAKWTQDRIGQAELLTFHGKVTGKATWARGLFVSYGGFTRVGLEALAHGRRAALIAMDADDLLLILAGRMSLTDALHAKMRRAAEENRVYVPLRELTAEDSGAAS